MALELRLPRRAATEVRKFVGQPPQEEARPRGQAQEGARRSLAAKFLRLGRQGIEPRGAPSLPSIHPREERISAKSEFSPADPYGPPRGLEGAGNVSSLWKQSLGRLQKVRDAKITSYWGPEGNPDCSQRYSQGLTGPRHPEINLPAGKAPPPPDARPSPRDLRLRSGLHGVYGSRR